MESRQTLQTIKNGDRSADKSKSKSASKKRKTKREAPARIACIHLPSVAVGLEMRDEPTLVSRALAIESIGPGTRVIQDASHAARRAGLTRGMPTSQARKICPELLVRPARPAAYRDTFSIVLEVLSEFTSEVEPMGYEHSWLASSDLVPRTGREATLAQEILGRVHHETGLATRVGIAHGKLTSRIVTRYLEQRDAMVLPAGREVVFLGGLATGYLPLTTPTRRRLSQLGIGKIHQYAGLPGAGILPRFGYEGLRAWRLSHGHDDPRVRPWREEPPLEAAQTFPEPISNHRSLNHHAERLVERIAGPLAAEFRMASEIGVRVTFERGHVETRRRELLEPTGRAATLLAHVEGLMKDMEWREPVERLEITARGLCPTIGRQLDLFRKSHEDEAAIEESLRDLQGRFGPEAVRTGRLLDPVAPLHERRAILRSWEKAAGKAAGTA